MRIGRVLLALLVLVQGSVAARADEVIDRVLAVVAGDIILLSDVKAARELGLVEVAGTVDPDREALTRLIDRSLMLAEADRYAPPEPTAQAVDAALAALRDRTGSAQAFETALRRGGLDETQLRAILRENLRIREYLNQRFAAETPERQRVMVEEWVAGLRRRAEITDLYAAP
jgi:hypothetical protein